MFVAIISSAPAGWVTFVLRIMLRECFMKLFTIHYTDDGGGTVSAGAKSAPFLKVKQYPCRFLDSGHVNKFTCDRG